MDKDLEICGREKEVKIIYDFVSKHVDNNQPGILYLTGPPGTGKTMSMNLVLDKVRNLGKLRLNCFRAQSSKAVLAKLCEALDIKMPTKTCESSMINLLAKKLTGRTSKPFLLVLDEMDKLPKSNNTNFFHTLFAWTRQSFSKLIIIGIANTLNLTARCQAFATFIGSEDKCIEKLIFKPYTSKDIQAILHWYLENDENFEEAEVDPKVIELISKSVSREKGDIRMAIDKMRDTIYDSLAKKRKREPSLEGPYPTPPSTPPLSPRKEKTNLASVANSVRKRQRESHYFDDKAPPASEIVLVCLLKICSTSKDNSADSKMFYGKVRDILTKYGTTANHLDVKSILEQLELQGTITLKKRPKMLSDKIILKASETEISRLSRNKDTILSFLTKYL